MDIMWLFPFIIGVIVGLIISDIKVTYGGIFKIDQKKPDKDLYLIDLEIDLDKLPKKKWIKFKVDSKANLSRGGSSNGRDE